MMDSFTAERSHSKSQGLSFAHYMDISKRREAGEGTEWPSNHSTKMGEFLQKLQVRTTALWLLSFLICAIVWGGGVQKNVMMHNVNNSHLMPTVIDSGVPLFGEHGGTCHQ